MAKYTVRQATPTGKVDPKFGIEYIVHFNESDLEVRLSKKDPVVEGQEFNGEIKTNTYGSYFKKDPFVPGAQGQPQQTAAKPAYVRKDNSDGMRQGMCMNNAANYVNSLEFPKALTDKEWATLVHDYASTLYRLGDLVADVPEDQPAPTEELTNVQAVFGKDAK